MATNGTSSFEPPKGWHSGPDDSFHGIVTTDGPFKPEKDRYHLYIGLFCPFAHRANLVLHLKQLHKYAGIDVSVVKPYPKDDGTKEGKSKGWPGWQFNLKQDEGNDSEPDEKGEVHGWYRGATVDPMFGSKYMHELYFKADPEYEGKYSVPVLWDKKLNTIVNNESAELMRWLQHAFDPLLPDELKKLDFYPDELKEDIDKLGEWMQRDLNTGVYKTGFAPNQHAYEKNLPAAFGALNKLEKIASTHGGPYLLGKHMTELDIRAYATIVRFDTVYVQHFKCNLGSIRHNYPVLNNWLKNLYHNHEEFRNTTNFRHIKENYTKSHDDINPLHITPVGPYPDVEEGYEGDWSKIKPGEIGMKAVKEHEKSLG